jgi:hypothetical protein
VGANAAFAAVLVILGVPLTVLLAPLCVLLPALAVVLAAGRSPRRVAAWAVFAAALLLWTAEAGYLFLAPGPTPREGPLTWFGGAQSVTIASSYVVLLVMVIRAAASLRLRATPLAICIALVTVAGVILRVLYPPHIAHVDLKGAGLIDDILGFPHPATFQPTYGQTSFFTLGLLASFAGTLRSIVTANALIGAALIPVAAALVHRWTGSVAASVAAALLVALNPAFVRVAASEEARNVGVVLLFSSLLAMDVYALCRAKIGAIVVVMLLLVLTAWSRQDLLPLLLIPFLLLMERAGWRSLFRFEVVVTAVVGVLAACAAAWYSVVNHRTSDGVIAAISGEPLIVLAAIARGFIAEPHPLIRPLYSPFPLPLLVIVGLARIWKMSTVRWTVCVGLGLSYFLTALAWAWGPGAQAPLRLPVLGFALILASVGTAFLWTLLGAASKRGRLAGAAVATAAVAVFLYGTVSALAFLARPTPQTEELLFLERAVNRLPAGARILTPELSAFAPTNVIDGDWPWRFPRSLLRKGRNLELGRSVESGDVGDPDRCVLFYRGLPCYTLGFAEGYYSGRKAFHDVKDISVREMVEWWADLASALQTDEIQPSPDLLYERRHLCFDSRYTQHPLRDDLIVRVTKPWRTYIPIVYFPLQTMELGFYRVSSSGSCTFPGK